MLGVVDARLTREGLHFAKVTVSQVLLQLNGRLNVSTGTESGQVGVVDRSRDGDRTRAAGIQMAKHVRQVLQLVGHQIVIVNQH